jgi:pimeloyl-ACP methyl ester carboxylesterase
MWAMVGQLDVASTVTPFSDVPSTHVMRLSDGRRLAYAEWGTPEGIPIIHQHGMPGSRLDHEADPQFYRALGVRVITPDRPGYGLSDPHPHGRLVDWPADVVELADELGLGRFGITALSGGGIYALACAAAIPERLADVVVTGCPAPMDRAGAKGGMRLTTRAGVFLAARSPWLVQGVVGTLAGVIRRHPDFFVDNSNRDKPPADRLWMSIRSVRAGAESTLREAFRRGADGYVHDLTLLAGPWGFDPATIRVPVQLWHGDQDTVIPLHHSRYLASVMPGATLHVCAGEAHMLMWNHLAEILMAAAGSGVAAVPES